MVVRSKGSRRGTRFKLKKNLRDKGKVSIRKLVQEFKKGERVKIFPEPSIQSGIPHKRFFGKDGVVVEKRGKAYVLEVEDGNMTKKVITLPVHLRR